VTWPGSLGFLSIFIVTFACSGRSETAGASDSAGAGRSATPTSEDDSEGAWSGSGATTGSADNPIAVPNLGDPGDCCSAHDGPGCGNELVAECVCELGSYCCNTAWDTACVSAVDELGCGICPLTPLPADDGSGSGSGGTSGVAGDAGAGGVGSAPEVGDWTSCCAKQVGAGCGDELVEACVCHVDAYCCDKKWDRYCAEETELLGCAACGTFTGAAGAGAEGGAGGAGG
jgi:hypothetical protein